MIRKYEKDTIYFINNRFKTLNLLAEIMMLEPPCTVGICYHDEKQVKAIQNVIDKYIPLGVEYKLIRC